LRAEFPPYHNLFLEQEGDTSDKTDNGHNVNILSGETAVQSLNESLQNICELTVTLRKIGEADDSATKIVKIESAVRKMIFGMQSNKGMLTGSVGPDSIILQQAEDNFWKQHVEVSELTILTLPLKN
jgi:hypothetical protein